MSSQSDFFAAVEAAIGRDVSVKLTARQWVTLVRILVDDHSSRIELATVANVVGAKLPPDFTELADRSMALGQVVLEAAGVTKDMLIAMAEASQAKAGGSGRVN